jgi:hypothetical protein
VHYLLHQLLDHLLADDAILLARQFCDCLGDCVDNFVRFSGIDFVRACLSYSSIVVVRTVIPLRRPPPQRSWFQSPVPRVKRRKRRNGFRQSGADWETAAHASTGN